MNKRGYKYTLAAMAILLNVAYAVAGSGGDLEEKRTPRPGVMGDLLQATYTYSVSPNVADHLADPDLAKMTDGQPSHVAWRRKKVVDIDFDLERSAHIDQVIFEAYRPNQNWFVKKVSLFVDAGNGFELVDALDTGLAWGTAVEESYRKYRFDGINRDALKVRLRFENGGSHFSIVNAWIYGQEVDSAPDLSLANVDATGTYQYQLSAIGAGLLATAVNIDSDSELEVVLQNDYMTVVIEPSQGGIISALKIPGHADYTMAPELGLFSDHVTSQAMRGDWWGVPYEYEILEAGPEQVSVRLWRRGVTGTLAFLTFAKTYTLAAKKNTLDVHYEVVNDPNALVPLSYGLWFHNFVGLRGWETPGTLNYLFPIANGVKRIDPATIVSEKDIWVQGPTRGWVGVLDVKHDAGLVFHMDYRYLRTFYSWWSGLAIPTLEWRFVDVSIPNGDSFETTVTVQPFHGLPDIAGATNELAASLQWNEGEIVVKLSPSISGGGDMALRLYRLPNTEATFMKRRRADFKAGETITMQFSHDRLSSGTWVAELEVKQGERTIGVYENSNVVKESSGTFVLSPREEKYRPESRERDLAYTSMEVQTPHIKWAKPYHGGATKAILLTASYLSRDIIEIAQRMDLEFDSTYIYPTYLQYGLGDYVAGVAQSDLDHGLEQLWKRTPDWDVLVVAGPALEFIPVATRQMIVEKVAEGRGLVIVEPSLVDPIRKILPVADRGTLVEASRWKHESDHYITRGIPFGLLPATDVYKYEQVNGQTLVSAGGSPLVVASTYEKGRVVTIQYRAGSAIDSMGRPVGLMPLMNTLGRELASPPTVKPYYEYQFSVLIRALLWAAKNVSGVTIQDAEWQADELRLTLGGDDEAVVGRVTWAVRDNFGLVIGRGQHPVVVERDHQDLTIELPVRLARGSVDVWLRDDQGRVYDWASIAIENHESGRIKSVDIQVDSIRPSSEFDIDVQLTHEPVSQTLQIQFFDGFGRLVFEKEKDAFQHQVVRANVDGLLNRLLEVHVTLSEDGSVIDRDIVTLPVQFPRKVSAREGDPVLAAWTSFVTHGRGFGSYLLDPLMTRLRGMGVNTMLLNPKEDIPSMLDASLRNDMQMLVKHNGLGSDPKTAGTVERPQRDREIYDVLPKLHNSAARYPEKYLAYGAIESLAGDENRLAFPGQDLSFAPSYLQAFRAWLRDEYGSLDKLNHQWGMDFRNWDEVIPPTLKSLKEAKSTNYSGWVDHRYFGNVSFARYFDTLRQVTEDAISEYRVGLSGTPYPDAYNGYDYWLLSQATTGIQTYYGTDEMVAFSPSTSDIRHWTEGHQEGGSAVKFSIYDHYFRGGTGFNIWAARLLFKPDMRYSTFGQGFVDHYKPVDRGIGRLLLSSQFRKSPVAVHYAKNAVFVAHAMGESDLWKETRQGAVKIVENLGYDPNWLSYEQIERGGLSKCRVLILPASYSLGGAEVDAIRTFVEQGGTLVGLMRAGIADGHGRVLASGTLDDVFGIERSGITLEHQRGDGDDVLFESVERLLQPIEAEVIMRSADGTPLAMRRKYGRGEAWYICADIASLYMQKNAARTIKRNADDAMRVENLFRRIMGDAHVARLVEVKRGSGDPLPFVKVSRFEANQLMLVAMIRDYPVASSLVREPEIVTVGLSESGYVTEVFSGRSFGYASELEAVMAADSVMLYAIRPYLVQAVTVEPRAKVVEAGQSVQVAMNVVAVNATPGLHVFRVEVFDPIGKQSSFYSCNLTADEGCIDWQWFTALNEQAGGWRIEVTDITSGLKGVASVEVVSGK